MTYRIIQEMNRSKHRWGQKVLSLLLAVLLVVGPVLTVPSEVEAASNSLQSGATYFTDSDNWGGQGVANTSADLDLDTGIKNQNNNSNAGVLYSKYPVEFKIENVTKQPTKSAHLLIRALDVDEYYEPNNNPANGEWDRVYFSSNPADIALVDPYTAWDLGDGLSESQKTAAQKTWASKVAASGIGADGRGYLKEITESAYLGTLSGKDGVWNTTVISFDPSDLDRIALGDNYVGITIHHYYQDTRSSSSLANTNWQMTVDWGQLIIDGGDRIAGEITDAGLKVDNGKVTIDTSFIPKLPSTNYAIEVNLIEKTIVNGEIVERNVGLDKKLFTNPAVNNETDWSDIVITDSTISTSKEYVVNIVLFEDRGGGTASEKNTNPGKAAHVVTFSTNGPTVQEIQKSGYREAPTYMTASDFQNKFVSDEELKQVKITSLPDAQKGKLMLNGTDVVLNQVILVDQLQLLAFQPVAGGFDGTVEYGWNGHDGTRYASDPARVIVNSSPDIQDMSYTIKSTDSSLTFTGPDGFASHFIDPGTEPLQQIVIRSLPDHTLGKLVLADGTGVSTSVTVGQEISVADIGKLSFIPVPGQGGQASFGWNGSDGMQYAKNDAVVTISINNAPVVSDIVKSGKKSVPITFSTNDFANSTVYTDADGQPLHSVTIALPASFSTLGTLKYKSGASEMAMATGSTTTLLANQLVSLVFEPAPGLVEGATVTFSWYGNDGIHDSEQPANVIMTFFQRPVAEALEYFEKEGVTSIDIELQGESKANPANGVTGAISTPPTKGTLVKKDLQDVTDLTWIYTPDRSFTTGTDSFTYTVEDSEGLVSDPVTVTIHMDKALNGWVGDKGEGDPSVTYGIPGELLKMSAVSSRWADAVTANVNGNEVSLTLANGSTWQTDGYKLWVNDTFRLSTGTASGNYTPIFTALDANNKVLEIEATTLLIDNKLSVLDTVLTLAADPEEILGDGKSTTELTSLVTDGKGNPIEGVAVTFSAPTNGGTFVGSPIVVTDKNGKAKIIYVSTKVIGVDKIEIPVKAKVLDLSKGLSAENQIKVKFMPATISGIITKGSSTTPIAGAAVRVMLDLNSDGIIDPSVDYDQTVYTDAQGRYSVIVPKGDVIYDLEVQQIVDVGGVSTTVKYRQQAVVGKSTGAGGENFDSVRTATGIILFSKPDGQNALLPSNLISHSGVYLKQAGGSYIESGGVPKRFTLDNQGVFNADGLAVGNYELELRYEIEPGKEIVFARKLIAITESGQLNIIEALVDPYGTITDAVTKKAIEGAKVVLHYADTPRNVSKGITPGTTVTLPVILGFAPNDNASPEQSSDSKGFYAYMVYPETDYYIIVTKNGYYNYKSPVLSVEWDIVKHDLALNPVVYGGGMLPTPNVTLNVSIDRNVVKEGEVTELTVSYKNIGTGTLSTGQVILKLPEGAEVVSTAGGTESGNDIIWTVSNLASGKGGSFKPVVKWLLLDEAEEIFDVSAVFADGGTTVTSLAKVNVYSDRFGELNHYRYILGYPDKQFKPNRSMTRAELAAIVARLTENKTVDYPLPYTDIREGYWATNYIRIATKHGFFQGGQDGKFRPDDSVTRGELAIVMARFLKLEAAAPVDRHFTDTSGHWAGDVIEALYTGKFLKGYTDGSFKPSNTITRVEAVTMINRMLYRGPLYGLQPLFPDMPETHWGFGEVQESTQSHLSDRNDDGSEKWIKELSDTMQ